ncbi:hypothetical protein H920_12150 [Fukomys damarensis]|uniref:Uncharacterized protein n=1 Tax=Fukomys damarensis TaxID=885580 RepID=A0A091D2Z5_FUKDA|nr:hypothetical protein H920_12150 [Fukomys damarensis]
MSPRSEPPTARPQEAQNGPASAPDAFAAGKPSPPAPPLRPSPPPPRAESSSGVQSREPGLCVQSRSQDGGKNRAADTSNDLLTLGAPPTPSLVNKVQLYSGQSKSRTLQELQSRTVQGLIAGLNRPLINRIMAEAEKEELHRLGP